MYFVVLPQQSYVLGIYRPILLHLLGNTRRYSPSCQTNMENYLFQHCHTRKDNTGSITVRNWECLYYDSRWDIRWNIVWAFRKSLVLSLYFNVYPSFRLNTDTICVMPNLLSIALEIVVMDSLKFTIRSHCAKLGPYSTGAVWRAASSGLEGLEILVVFITASTREGTCPMKVKQSLA